MAGRLVQIPMLASIDSQYNFLFRVLLKQTRQQSYNLFYYHLFYHLKLAYLQQSYIFSNVLQTTATASDNIRFVRFR